MMMNMMMIAMMIIISYMIYKILMFYIEFNKQSKIIKNPTQLKFPLGHIASYKSNFSSKEFWVELKNEYLSEYGGHELLLFHLPIIITTTYEDLKNVFKSVYRRKFPFLGKHSDAFLGSNALTALMNKEWRFHRNVMGKAFGFAKLPLMMKDIVKCTNRLNLYLENHYADTAVPNLHEFLQATTLDVIGVTAFGLDFNCITDQRIELPPAAKAFLFLLQEQTRRQRATIPIDPRIYFYWWPNEHNRRHAKEKKILNNFVDDVIDRNMNAKDELSENFLKYMIDASDETEGNRRMSKKALRDNIITLLFAGYDTTSLALTYTLYLLAKHGDVLKKLQKVVDEAIPSLDEFDYETVRNLDYVVYVLKEGLRLFPPVPITVRTLTKDTHLNGREVKAGNNVFIPIDLVHTSEHNFE